MTTNIYRKEKVSHNLNIRFLDARQHLFYISVSKQSYLVPYSKELIMNISISLNIRNF